MTTEHLHEFVVLARTLNFSKAAEYLFISQSVLSKHIAEIEKELSVKLFIRSTHDVELTEEGKLLYHESLSMIQKSEFIMSFLSMSVSQTEGSIRLRCHEQTLCPPILSFINNFKSRYKNISIETNIINSADDITSIGDADVLLSPCDFMDRLKDSFIGKHIYSQNAELAIPPYHHLGDLHDMDLCALEHETILVPYANELFGPYARNYFLAQRKSRGILQKITTPTVSDAILKVELGEGVMILPESLKGRLYSRTRTIRITNEECFFPVYIYTRKNNPNQVSELFYENILQNEYMS